MPVFQLQLGLEAEGVSSVVHTNPVWIIQFRCTKCNEEQDSPTAIDTSDSVEIEGAQGPPCRPPPRPASRWPAEVESTRGTALPPCTLAGSRGTAHLQQKCSFCGCKFNATLGAAREWAEAGGLDPQTLVDIECRGCEPVSWVAAQGFTVKGAEGGEMEDVDFSEGEWADYVEDTDEALTVLSVTTSVEAGASAGTAAAAAAGGGGASGGKKKKKRGGK